MNDVPGRRETGGEDRFYHELVGAAEVPWHEFEQDTSYFEGCLPIEEMARRRRETLLSGPMKPVGLVEPRTGRQPFGVVQLRQDTLAADFYSMVGFQNHLRFEHAT